MKPSISWLTVVLWSTCWIAVLAAPMATEVDVRVDDRQQPGCLYNDQLYAEGDTVPTKESCLNCSCRQGALRCHLQVCPYAHDLYPPPVGCILVERKGGCCPKLHCPDHTAENGLARKDPSGQLSAWKLRDDLRRRLFKQISRHASDKQGCIEGGTAYADGSGMMSSSTCEYCFCLKGKQTCVKPRCHTPLGKEGCVPRFRPMVCCPVQYDCDGSPAVNGTAVQDPHVRPLMGSQANNVRGNDRIIESPAEKQMVRRRRAPEAEEAKASTEASAQPETDKMEPESATDSPAVAESAASDDSGSVVEDVKKVEPEAPVEAVKMDPVEVAKPADAVPKAEESANPEPEKSADPAPKPEESTATATKPEASADPVPKAEEPAAPAKAEAASDPAPEAEKSAEPESKPEASADPVPQPKPDESVESVMKPEESADPAPKPEESVKAAEPEETADPAPKPEESADPAPKPEESADPAPKPEESVEPAAKPEESADPAPKPEEASADPAPKPEESVDPATKPEESANPAPKPEESADPVPKPEESAEPAAKPEESADPATKPEESADPAPKPEEKVEAVPEESAAKPNDAQDRLDADDQEDELDADGAERAIQVSVKHSVSSVTGQKTEAEDPSAVETSRTTQDVSQEKRISSVSVNVSVNEAPSNSTDTEDPEESKEEESAPESPAPVQENFVPSLPAEEEEAEEEQDYDYQHMELPPSLPNLEIIPFVAADAVVGHPNADMDDDERLNLGGVADQRTPISQLSPTGDQSSTTEYCFVDGGFFSHGELISKPDPCLLCRCNLGRVMCTETQCAPLPDGCHRKERPGFCCGQVVCGSEGQKSEPVETPGDDRPSSDPVKVKESPPSTTLSPLLAFRVTFPPRPSSTLPSSPSPAFIRFPTKRPTTTQRPTPPTTTLRTKFNKPAAANNLLGSSFATGGLKVDSCNIYGQVYRVGRIIEELSGPCIECKCTEIGVNCFPLKC